MRESGRVRGREGEQGRERESEERKTRKREQEIKRGKEGREREGGAGRETSRKKAGRTLRDAAGIFLFRVMLSPTASMSLGLFPVRIRAALIGQISCYVSLETWGSGCRTDPGTTKARPPRLHHSQFDQMTSDALRQTVTKRGRLSHSRVHGAAQATLAPSKHRSPIGLLTQQPY